MLIVKTITAGPAQTNCYVVGCDQTRQAALIDPGWDAPAILKEVESADLTVKMILLTHAHFDHIGAVADVIDATHAPLAIHPRDLDWLRAKGGADAFGIRIRSAPEPDVLLEHGQHIDIGALTFETRFTPGHTPGHVVFVERAEQAVFDGDVLFQGSIGRTDLPGGDYDTLIASIRAQLLTLPDDTTVYSGHGPPTTIGAERQFNPFLT